MAPTGAGESKAILLQTQWTIYLRWKMRVNSHFPPKVNGPDIYHFYWVFLHVEWRKIPGREGDKMGWAGGGGRGLGAATRWYDTGYVRRYHGRGWRREAQTECLRLDLNRP